MEPDFPTNNGPPSAYPPQAQAIDVWYVGDDDAMDIDLIDPALNNMSMDLDPIDPALNNMYPVVIPNPLDPNAPPFLPPPPLPPPPPALLPPQLPQPPQDQPPRIPLEVMQRIAANVARVQAVLSAMGASQSQNQNQDAPNPPSTPPNRSTAPNPKGKNVQSSPVDLLERLRNTLDNLPDDPLDGPPPTLPRRKRDMLTLHDLFTLLRAAPPTVGCVIPNSERQIWYRPTQQDYVELNQNGVVDLVQTYLKPSYLTTYLTNGCGFVQGWFMYDKTQWCTCRYDPENTRFVRDDEPLGGNGTGALVVGYRTPWAPICNGCRGDRSVEVRALDYLARWFSFPVPEGSNILDIMEARAQAERFQQGDGAGPWTPNGPPPEPEGQAGIELTVHSKALSRKFQSLLQGFSGEELDSPGTNKPKRIEIPYMGKICDICDADFVWKKTAERCFMCLENKPSHETIAEILKRAMRGIDSCSNCYGEANRGENMHCLACHERQVLKSRRYAAKKKAMRTRQAAETGGLQQPGRTNAGDVKSPTGKPKRRRYEGGDETGEGNKRQRVEEKRHPLPDGSWLYDPFVDGASAGVPLSGGDLFSDAGDPMMLDDDDDWGPAAAPPAPNNPPHVATGNNKTNNNNNNNPQAPQRPQQPQHPQHPQGANAGGIPPRATAADAHARLAAEGKEYPEWPEELPPGQHCNNCKNDRMKPAKERTKKCQKCVDTHAKIREINKERGYCTNAGCNRHMGIPRPLKDTGEPYAYCAHCRDKGRQKHATKQKAKKGQGGGGE